MLKNFFRILPAFAVLPYAVLLMPSASLHHAMMKEDGVFETGSALCWLFCVVIFFYLYRKDRQGCDLIFVRTGRNIFLLLLAGVFFFGFGEEISWGQRIFGLSTPEPLREINEQGELNIHNLAGFQIESLFSLFWFTYAFALPLAVRLSRPVAVFIGRLNLPVVPLWIGILFPVNYAVSKLFQPCFTGAESNFPVEAKEFVFALLFLTTGAAFLQTYLRRGAD